MFKYLINCFFYHSKGVLLLCSMAISFSVAGQGVKVIPPSPEAASLFKFSEVPVSLYAGLANTGVNLFQVSLKGINISVQIGYHGRGIQVGELSSSVGSGWSLSYGGLISRQIRGSADDSGQSLLNSFYYNDVFTDANKRSLLMADIVQGADEVPDQFMLDMNGESAKFFFNPIDKQILQQKYSDILITPIRNDGKIVAWITKDKLGNTFYFGRSKDGARVAVDEDWVMNSYSFSSETNQLTLAGDGNSPRNINSWRLMEIETPANERVEFFYEEEVAMYYRKSFDKNVGSGWAVSHFSDINSHQQQIREIRFNGGKILFSPKAVQREDLVNSFALGRVGLYNAQNSLLKEFVFDYQYTTAPSDANVLNYLNLIDPAAKKRLFLSSVREKNVSVMHPPTLFDYNQTLLPSRFSTSQDNWGYYNGKANGEYLVFFNKNRSVDTAFAEAGMLKKITYPTGGSVEFTYEHNKGVPPAFMDQLLYPENNGYELVEQSQGMIKAAMYYDGTLYSKPVVIGAEKQGFVNFNMMLPYCPGGTANPSYCNYSVTLSNASNTYYLYPNGGVNSLDILPGNYTLSVIPQDGHDPADVENLFIFDIKWMEKKPSTNLPVSVWMGPGKRIRKMAYTDGQAVVKTKEYGYNLPSGETSGSIFGLPNFYFLQNPVGTGVSVPIYDQYGSLPGSPLTNLQGNGVGYAMVTEYFGGRDVNIGKTENEFTVYQDAGDFYKFPYHDPVDNEWLRGKLLSSRTFEKNTSGYTLKKSIVNTYAYAGTDGVPWSLMTPFVPEVPGYAYEITRRRFYVPLIQLVADPNNPMSYSFKVYYKTGGTEDLASTVETDYSAEGNIVTHTGYSYDYDRHYQLAKTEKNDSKGGKTVTNFIYPATIASRTSAEQALLDAHRVGEAVTIETILRSPLDVELSRTTQHTEFKDFGSGLIMPGKTQVSYNGLLAGETEYRSYDPKGNPVELLQKDGPSTTYLWSYNGRYPVAEIKNTSYAEVMGVLGSSVSALYVSSLDKAAVDALVASLHVGLPNAYINSYVYDPLVGMTSQTDAKGQTTYYEYDEFQRLMVIKDRNGHIVKSYDYHFKQ